MKNLSDQRSQLEREAIHAEHLARLQDIHWKAMRELIAKHKLTKYPCTVPDPHTGVPITFSNSELFSQFVWQLVCKNHY